MKLGKATTKVLSSVGVTKERVAKIATKTGLIKEGEDCGCDGREEGLDDFGDGVVNFFSASDKYPVQDDEGPPPEPLNPRPKRKLKVPLRDGMASFPEGTFLDARGLSSFEAELLYSVYGERIRGVFLYVEDPIDWFQDLFLAVTFDET